MSFKVGDLLCMVTDSYIQGYNDGVYNVLDIGDLVFLRDRGEVRRIHEKYLRHATPAEIAAGRRIEIFGNSEELEVLEMIDVSPNCEVSEL